VRAISLHPDVIVVTSRLLQTNCAIVRGLGSADGKDSGEAPAGGETFVIDSPILPDELAMLPSLLEQAHFPPPHGLLATHADWDHLLGRIPFPDATLGCAETSAVRLQSHPGAAQRELRAFDEELYIVRERPLQLGAFQALPVPGSCAIGDFELELHPAPGHTADGMAILASWAGVLIVGDYLSNIEIPTIGTGGDAESLCETLRRLRPLVARAEHIVPGHGPVLDSQRALEVLEQDAGYLEQLRERGADAELPRGRRSAAQRELHAANVAAL
jgi:glyoxylase-like metal-dependent hydrolase (beta-lactamase superfamily II)